ncbi:Dabb family protein [Collimonas antrihumi]|uniref:Dabb family protein n=1 Tax=Collimonas antrihumi TaxID=1940615 RepID=UPI001B8B51B1|nr:Dabb family protein [Collimonas antrihumi]
MSATLEPTLKHLVFWKLKEHAEGADKASNAVQMKAMLDGCAGIVPGMLKFEVAIAQPGLEATYDVVLNAEFTSQAALDAYQNHPTHVAIKPFFGAVREARQCMDYLS